MKPYRDGATNVQLPESKGLIDLYVRFFRMAERRIAEKTGQGIICFISNYSWLDGLSFAGMRERFLESFDAVRIDCLNGDKYKTGKTTPGGAPDPSIFSTPERPGWHSSGHGNHNAGSKRRPQTPTQDRGVPPSLGPGQTRRSNNNGRDGSSSRCTTTFQPNLALGLPLWTRWTVNNGLV